MSDDKALNPKALIIRLNGYDYEWPQPATRIAREQMADILELQEAFDGMPSSEVRMVNRILDFFYRHNPAMERAAFSIDESDGAEIAQAFRAVSEYIAAPFVKAAERKKAASTKGADTPEGDVPRIPNGEAAHTK